METLYYLILRKKHPTLHYYFGTRFYVNFLQSITNASLIHERIRELGYSGGLTSIKDYIAQHRALISAKRQLVANQGSRGTRYQSEPVDNGAASGTEVDMTLKPGDTL